MPSVSGSMMVPMNIRKPAPTEAPVTIPTIVARLKSESAERREASAPLTTLEQAPDEAILLRLVAHEVELLDELRKLERRLLRRVDEAMESPRDALGAAQLLREVVRTDGAIARKVREALLAASTLRARRLLLENGGPNEV